MGMEGYTTLGQLAAQTDTRPDTMQRKFRRYAEKHPDIFPDNVAILSRPLSDEQVAILSGRQPVENQVVVRVEAAPRKPRAVKKSLTPQPVKHEHGELPEPVAEEPPVNRSRWQKILLYGLLLAPTAASVHNMFIVTLHVSGTVVDAVLLTVVLACTAIGFILAGSRNTWTFALAVLLIAFESFCNLTKIYGGLMGIGTTGNPTRFLGLVCDILGSGSHYTAVFIGAVTALFIAATQYAAIFELNKK